MYRYVHLFLTIILTCFFSAVAAAQTTEDAPKKPLIVGTKVTPPFVIKDDDGNYSGISIELWQKIAEDQGLEYEYRETDLAGLIEGLEDGSLDVSVAALTVTAEREQRIDFTHPFHTTGLSIAVARKQHGALDVVQRFFSWKFLLAIAALGALLLIIGFLLWLVERKKNAAMFGGSPAQGIGSSFWWAAVTMTTVGYGDKAPVTLAGRFIGIIWMFAGLIIVSSFTAAITTALTVSQLDSGVKGLSDLPDANVATVKGSVSAEFLQHRGIAFSPAPDLQTAIDGLANRRFQAVVYDRPILLHLIHEEYPRRTDVLADTFERQDYAIAIAQNSDLRTRINLSLLRTIADDTWQNVLKRYLGADTH